MRRVLFIGVVAIAAFGASAAVAVYVLTEPGPASSPGSPPAVVVPAVEAPLQAFTPRAPPRAAPPPAPAAPPPDAMRPAPPAGDARPVPDAGPRPLDPAIEAAKRQKIEERMRRLDRAPTRTEEEEEE